MEKKQTQDQIMNDQPAQEKAVPLPEAWRRFFEAVQKQYSSNEDKNEQ